MNLKYGILIVLFIFSIGAIAPVATAPLSLSSPVSDSMNPTIEETDIVLITSDGEYETGDIILFESSESQYPVLHRIVDVDNGKYVTKGDSNNEIDQSEEYEFDHVSQADIYGSVSEFNGNEIIIPFLGAVVSNEMILVSIWGSISILIMISPRRRRGGGSKLDKDVSKRLILIIILLFSLSIPAISISTSQSEHVQISNLNENVVDGDTEGRVAVGNETQMNVSFKSPSLIGFQQVSVIESDDIRIVEQESGTIQSETVVTVRNQATEETNIQTGTLDVFLIPGFIPYEWNIFLSSISIYIPMIISGVIVSSILFLLGFIFNRPNDIDESSEL